MEFEWDSRKAESNLAKHHVDFADAIDVFDDPDLLTRVDRRIVGEARYQAIGAVNGRTLFVVYTFRGETCRIISARRANRREREAYSLPAGHRS